MLFLRIFRLMICDFANACKQHVLLKTQFIEEFTQFSAKFSKKNLVFFRNLEKLEPNSSPQKNLLIKKSIARMIYDLIIYYFFEI